MPIVGIVSCSEISLAILAGTASNSSMKQPASSIASASSRIFIAASALRPWILKPPNIAMVWGVRDRKSTRLNSSHTVIYTFPYTTLFRSARVFDRQRVLEDFHRRVGAAALDIEAAEHRDGVGRERSEEHTSELQSHRDLHFSLHDALPICPRLRSPARPRGFSSPRRRCGPGY